MHGTERVAKVLDFSQYQAEMVGQPGARGWIARASVEARELLLQALSPDEVQKKLDALRKSQPREKATWRSV
jgi:hypothetical protein